MQRKLNMLSLMYQPEKKVKSEKNSFSLAKNYANGNIKKTVIRLI